MTQRARRLAAAAALGVQFAVLYIPRTPELGVAGLPWDKVVHAAAFALPTYALIRAGVPRVPVVGAMLVQAVGSELLQRTALPDRSGDVGDVLADLVGIGLGLALLRWRPHPGAARSDAPNRPGAPG